MRIQTLAFAIATALTAAPVFAANGDIDTAFASAGFRYVSFDLGGAKTDVPEDLARAPDGGYLAVGHATTASTIHGVAVRLSAAGGLEAGFGTQGKLHHIPQQGDDLERFYAAAFGGDGQEVLVGSARHFFGGPNSIYAFRGVAIGNEGGPTEEFQYGAGSVDVETEFRGAATDASGRVVLSGVYAPNNGGDREFYAFRYNLGLNDPSFGGDGDAIVPIDVGGVAGTDVSTAVVNLPDGTILQGGYAQITGTDYDFAIARLQSNGTPIGASRFFFDLAGSLKTDQLRAMTVDGQGRILLAGTVSDGPGANDTAIGLVRLKPNLAVDVDFGDNGKLVLDFDLLDPGARDDFGGIAVAPDGKILIVGTHYTGSAANVSDTALLRLKDDGDADFTFGTFGRELYDFGIGAGHGDVGVDLEIDGNRVVVLAQREYDGTDTDFLLFGVQSAQVALPDAVFKNSFE